MPIKIERKLKATAREKFPKDKERQDKYIYGTLAKLKKQGAKGFGDRDNWIPIEDTGIRFGSNWKYVNPTPLLQRMRKSGIDKREVNRAHYILKRLASRKSAISRKKHLFSDFRQKRKAAQKKYAKKISGWVSKKTYGQYRPSF